jgi:hypothetical protein
VAAVLAWPVFKSAGTFGNGTAYAGLVISVAPLAIALVALGVWSRATTLSGPLAVAAIVAGTGVGSIGGFVHYSGHARMFQVVVFAISGVGLGLAATLLRRDAQVVVVGLVVGVIAGALGGLLTPIAPFAHRGAWTAWQTLGGVISTVPLCLLIAFLPRVDAHHRRGWPPTRTVTRWLAAGAYG